MKETSDASIPIPRPESATEIWPHDFQPIHGGAEAEEPPASRPAAALRRIRKRAKLMRRRSMPLLGGTLLAVLLAAGA